MKKILALVLAVVLSFGALSVFAAANDLAAVDAAIDFLNDTPTVFDADEPYVQAFLSNGTRRVYVNLMSTAGDGVLDLTGMKIHSSSGSDLSSVYFAPVPADAAALKAAADAKVKVGTATSKGLVLTFKGYTGTSLADQTLKATVYLEVGGKKSDKMTIEVKYNPEDGTIEGGAISLTDGSVVTGMMELVTDEYEDTAVKGVVYKADESSTIDEVVFTGANGDVLLETSKIAKNAKFNLSYTADTPDALDAAYPFNDVDYFAITGSTSAINNWKLTFEDYDEDAIFAYAWVDGKLVNIPAAQWKYDTDDQTVLVQGTGAFYPIVLSATDLKVTANLGDATSTPSTSTPVENPATGSSDMIGVAVVMAVVSLAAAGAVAFKKAR